MNLTALGSVYKELIEKDITEGVFPHIVPSATGQPEISTSCITKVSDDRYTLLFADILDSDLEQASFPVEEIFADKYVQFTLYSVALLQSFLDLTQKEYRAVFTIDFDSFCAELKKVKNKDITILQVSIDLELV